MSADGCVIAIGAVSGFGVGPSAYATGHAGDLARVAVARDPDLERAGLRRPFAVRAVAVPEVPRSVEWPGLGDRATDLLYAALSGAVAGLDSVRPGWRNERVGVAFGTSSGGMLSAERFFHARETGTVTPELARAATYFAPLDAALEALGLAGRTPRTHVLAACAASTIAVGIGLRWLDRGACDVVLAGGYDALSVFVASGFEALHATSASRPRPFRSGRDGMALGEGAGAVAMVRGGETRGATVLARVAGFGASNDAVHITAPDATGGGLRRAAAAALADAGLAASHVDLVSAHGTATPYNDAMEARALRDLFGVSEGAVPPVVVHPFKAQIGHTLGAAGVLEMLAASEALRSGVAPASAGDGEMDPGAAVLLLERAEARPLRCALKLSAAFGGSNAALVLSRDPSGRQARRTRPVYLREAAHVTSAVLAELAASTLVAAERLSRLDRLCRLGLGAVVALAGRVGGRAALSGAGIVAGHGLATIETNAAFFARLTARGATKVEPRAFPSTSPNALAGECAIAFGLKGPSFAVGGGLDGGMEALRCAAELVAAGDADRMVVVAADDAGPAAEELARVAGWGEWTLASGATAVLLTAEEGGARREVTGDEEGEPGETGVGHLGLWRWVGAAE